MLLGLHATAAQDVHGPARYITRPKYPFGALEELLKSKNGLLTVTVPIAEETRAKKVEIHAA